MLLLLLKTVSKYCEFQALSVSSPLFMYRVDYLYIKVVHNSTV